MQITSSFMIKNADVIAEATSSLTLLGAVPASVSFSAACYFEPNESEYQHGEASLPSLVSFGGIIPAGYGSGEVLLPSLVTDGSDEDYLPPEPTEGFVNLKALYSAGTIKTTYSGDGDVSLPSLISIGGEGNYGTGTVSLPSLISLGIQGPGNYTAYIMSYPESQDVIETIFETIVYINSSGQVVGSISGTISRIESLLGSIEASDSYDLIGNFIVSIGEEIVVHFDYSASVDDRPDLNDSSRIWVVNVANKASSQYESYGFNSFFTDSSGVHYGVANDGIYELDGDTDNEIDIEALVNFGKSDFGSPFVKSVHNVYLGVNSTGKMFLKVETSGKEYTYEARSSSEDLKNHRVDPGKGLKGNYYNFTLISKGDDFDLETITFTPINLSRKI